MSEFKIEKGVPIPTWHDKYPLRDMEVGDSFFIPLSNDKKKNTSARNVLWQCSKPLGIKIATRTVDGGMRVWRKE